MFTVARGRPLVGRVTGPRRQVGLAPGPAPRRPGRRGVGGAGAVRRRRRGSHRRGASRALGAACRRSHRRRGDHGRSRAATAVLHEPAGALDMGNSGTTMRLLAGVVAGRPFTTRLTGDASLSSRPMDRVAVPLRLMGAVVEGLGARCLPPLTIRGGALRGIDYTTPMASAQVKSCVLLAGLAAEGETVVREPVLTRRHTEELLARCGAQVAEDVEERRYPRGDAWSPRPWRRSSSTCPATPPRPRSGSWRPASCPAARSRWSASTSGPAGAATWTCWPAWGRPSTRSPPRGPVTSPPPPTSWPASGPCTAPRSTPRRSPASTRSPCWPWRPPARRATRCSGTWGSCG